MSKQPYEKIYLIGWYDEYPRPTDFGDEVTWCQDPIGENDECPDIEYIRFDLHETALNDALGEVERLNSRVKYWKDWQIKRTKQIDKLHVERDTLKAELKARKG